MQNEHCFPPRTVETVEGESSMMKFRHLALVGALATGLGTVLLTGGGSANPAGPSDAAQSKLEPVSLAGTQEKTSSPQRAIEPIRRLDADEHPTGAEPDPESFDRSGLEKWWDGYQKALEHAE